EWIRIREEHDDGKRESQPLDAAERIAEARHLGQRTCPCPPPVGHRPGVTPWPRRPAPGRCGPVDESRESNKSSCIHSIKRVQRATSYVACHEQHVIPSVRGSRVHMGGARRVQCGLSFSTLSKPAAR